MCVCAEERQSLQVAVESADSLSASRQPQLAQSPEPQLPPAQSQPTETTSSTADETEGDVAWSHADTLLLIETYREHRTRLLEPARRKKMFGPKLRLE